jgi:eukaryotic-like serine/threonine-protein kinase
MSIDSLRGALSDRYRIERELGAGGMATVYLAEDLKHHRQVAIKVLRPELAAVIGAERFLAEIKTTANLQHPHILPLFDSGEADSFLFYVMPYVEGISLRDRLTHEKQLPVAEAVRIAGEVAAALDYAHRHGVIHRDIKPENVMLHDGAALVADFGIALAASKAGGGRMTETGMSLGTPTYMSPEQAMGERELDARSDVYALGCVTYEMLIGEPPFTGPTAQAIVAKVMTAEPAEMTSLRKTIPGHVADAVHTALQKLPADRFESAKEFAEALANPAFHSTGESGASARVRPHAASWRDTAITAGVGMLLLVAAAWGWLRALPEPVVHASIPPIAGTAFLPTPGWPALSPDGKTIVFAATSDGTSRLYRRPVDGFRIGAIEGSEDATFPFFSPDGASIGFFTGSRQLRKVPLSGGPATTLADIPFWSSGAAWRHDGTIVVISDSHGLYVVPDHGGSLVPLSESDPVIGTNRVVEPRELHDGTLVATRLMGTNGSHWAGSVVMLAKGKWQLVPGDGRGGYLPPGLLLSHPGTEFLARQFNLKSGQLSGSPLAVLAGLDVSGLSTPAVNDRGDVAYFAVPAEPPQYLVLVDHSGSSSRLPVPAGPFRHPRLSPDGSRLAMERADDLWILDLRTNAWTRVTTNDLITEPQWSPDGHRIIHTVYDSASGYNVPAWRNADGSGKAEIIRAGIGDDWTSDWSPDGRRIAVYGGKVGMNVSVVELDHPDSLHPVTRIDGTARNARFSPDGKWLAYQSNETGRMQVYVIAYPGLDQKTPVSTEGGTEPAWRPRGGELYYRNGQSMMSVRVTTSPTLTLGPPQELFRGPFLADLYGDRSYDVMPDGAHFLMSEANPAAAPELRVVRNWAAEVKSSMGRP